MPSLLTEVVLRVIISAKIAVFFKQANNRMWHHIMSKNVSKLSGNIAELLKKVLEIFLVSNLT